MAKAKQPKKPIMTDDLFLDLAREAAEHAPIGMDDQALMEAADHAIGTVCQDYGLELMIMMPEAYGDKVYQFFVTFARRYGQRDLANAADGQVMR